MMDEDTSLLENSVGCLTELNGCSSLKTNSNGFDNILPGHSKYTQLLSVLEEMSKDIRPTYAGSKSSAERLKRGIVHARILVRECLLETERSAAKQ